MPVIVCSSQNEVGVGAYELLKQKKANAILLKESALVTERDFDSDLVIFCYTHKSSTNSPCFTAHSQGNFGELPTGDNARLGGSAKTLAKASGTSIKLAYNQLLKQDLLPVFLEATHHGPTHLTAPSLFIELGATPKQWQDPILLETLVDSCIYLANNFKKEEKAVLGFGGTHYCNSFLELAKENNFSFICSKHNLDFVNEKILDEMINKTSEKVVKAFVDKKGCKSEQRKNIVDLLTSRELDFELV